MLQEFKNFIDLHMLTRHEGKVLLAVSGGIDSMVMTHLFMKMNYSIGIAHCNFALRGEESDLDEKLVKDFSSENSLPFYSVRFETRKYASDNGLSVQMAARDLRYTWFEKIRSDNGYDSIAVAHNLNDNAETMLINLTRGTGLSGLSGMQAHAGKIIRPLLFATRNNIVDYCNQNNISYREDRSNAETKYTRNKIRHLVIPLLKEINPSVEYTLNDTAARLSGLNEIIRSFTNDIREQVTTGDDSQKKISTDKLGKYLHNKFLLFEIFREYGLNPGQTDDLARLFQGKTGNILYTSSHRLVRNRDEIIITAVADSGSLNIVLNDAESLFRCSMFESSVNHLDNSFRFPDDPWTAVFDADRINYPLVIRKWEKGDYFFPLGMKHKKKLSDYFIDRKYSLPEKENKLILESDGMIAWIIGDRIDDRFRITGTTTSALILRSMPVTVNTSVNKE